MKILKAIKIWHFITAITGILTLGGLFYAPLIFADARYASAADGLSLHDSLQKLNIKLDQEIADRRANDQHSEKLRLQERMWQLQDHCSTHKCDKVITDEIRALQDQISQMH